jgi:pullulanase
MITQYDVENFDRTYAYDGQLGAVINPDKSVTFKLWAPTALQVDLVSYGKDYREDANPIISYPMVKQGNIWTKTLIDGLDIAYTYKLLLPADKSHDKEYETDTADPYAFGAIANGHRSVAVDLSDKDYSKVNPTWRVEHPTRVLVNEIHIRDFSISTTSGVSPSKQGKYLGMIEPGTHNQYGDETGLNYLENTLTNYVQILPFFDFATVPELPEQQNPNDPANDGYNWGYDPLNYNVPEGSYASHPEEPYNRIDECRQMIEGFHDVGIGVVMDVVYNHVYDPSTHPFQLTVPDYFFRTSSGSGVTLDVASERKMVRKYIVDSVVHWATHYNVDGFRFDLMGLIDIDTMNAVRAALDNIDPRILIYGEGWQMDTAWPNYKLANSINAASTPRIGYFNDKTRNAIKGAEVYGIFSAGFVNGKPSSHDNEGVIAKAVFGSSELFDFLSPGQSVNYIDAHDNYNLEDLTWLNNPHKSPDNPYGDTEDIHQMRLELANAINYMINGITFVQIGQTFGRTKLLDDEHHHWAANSYNAGDEVNKINWNLVSEHKEMNEFLNDVTRFKDTHPAFRGESYQELHQNINVVWAEEGSGLIAYEVFDAEDQYLVVFYANQSGQPLNLYDLLGYDNYSFLDSEIMVTNDRELKSLKGLLSKERIDDFNESEIRRPDRKIEWEGERPIIKVENLTCTIIKKAHQSTALK